MACPHLRPRPTYVACGLQEAGLLATAMGSWFSSGRTEMPLLPKPPTSRGCGPPGAGVWRGEDVVLVPHLCPHPCSVLTLPPLGGNFQPLIKPSPTSRSIFRGGVSLHGIFGEPRWSGSTRSWACTSDVHEPADSRQRGHRVHAGPPCAPACVWGLERGLSGHQDCLGEWPCRGLSRQGHDRQSSQSSGPPCHRWPLIPALQRGCSSR